ncbi:MAG: malectin domain-containing carbohydrate-binding protein, partial [Planctomycetota bacterium]
LRGIQPFHDFFEGPDWWNADDHKAYASQLAKLRMNFIGLHNYPERRGGYPGPEPTVWIGLPDDCDEQGRVTYSYPAFFANTQRPGWGNKPMKTSGYAGGAAALFPADDFGPDAQAGHFPWPEDPADCNEVFNRTADMYRDAFGLARSLGIKICVGTETPLTVPQRVKDRLKKLGRDPSAPDVVKDLYAGTFQRLSRAFPVDYYWLWTPESWGWGGDKRGQFEATTRDIQAALGALEQIGNPLTLGTCGWVLGPVHDRAALDAFLAKSSPMACINRRLGHEGVEPAFANVIGRPKWAIPWMENDVNMVGPQPWVGRMRYDAVDARRFGCTGLMGIHWRTKALEVNVAALAAAAWDQSWVPAGFDTTPVKPAKGKDGAIGGKTAHFGAPVADADTPAVYQNVRYDLKAYQLVVPDGTYTVTLQFNEPAHKEAGKRVFGVKIQGRQVITKLDVFARVGRNKALDLSFPDIEVSDGALRIDFTRKVEFPCIAGICISGKTKAVNQVPGRPFERRINCGGKAVAGYEADRTAVTGRKPSPKPRTMPVADFYLDYARANFGEAVAEPLAELLGRIDGVKLPEVSAWKKGPGVLPPHGGAWEAVRKRYAFVDELAALRPRVKDPGSRERFDYWLGTYQAMVAMAEVRCLRGLLDREMRKKDWQAALEARIELARGWTRLMTLQTAIVRTPGELGTIANLEHQTRRRAGFVEGRDAALVKALGKPLPPEAAPGQVYTGPAQLILPTVRSLVVRGERLKLKIIALDRGEVKSAIVHLRPLGRGDWRAVPAKHLGRAVHEVALPPAHEDFEYRLTAETSSGEPLVWPATAPRINQTVVVAPGDTQ